MAVVAACEDVGDDAIEDSETRCETPLRSVTAACRDRSLLRSDDSMFFEVELRAAVQIEAAEEDEEDDEKDLVVVLLKWRVRSNRLDRKQSLCRED